eukprot:CAMPEP_0179702694 /NCGR_PEP_ID=MMETSP0937-20121108/2408_1 /TAXON_ID=548131 ORGANISM="Ostreococcus mediterraneus, Strain clade-D-RCC2593" /NCGR_SAMPLE_ID=MMETSP0937 /ASSEMBLY_ACC=CAM_ASM_000575 /LENGTH=169 /DNA_ID=CAMNT_0021575833 /DNA_START=515 /DNA_END=1024 /DNA_ORIENTATION=+
MTGSDLNPMTWRFLAASDESVLRVCSRDIDSRLIYREFQAVSEWQQQSAYGVHIIRDHPSHTQDRCVMPGGMWCAQHGILRNMDHLIDAYNRNKGYNADQEFLATIVWPQVKHQAMQHVSFECSTHTNSRTLLPRVGMEHVGAVYLDGELRESDLELLRSAISDGLECS